MEIWWGPRGNGVLDLALRAKRCGMFQIILLVRAPTGRDAVARGLGLQRSLAMSSQSPMHDSEPETVNVLLNVGVGGSDLARAQEKLKL